MTVSEQLNQAMPAELAAQVKEAFRLLDSLPKFVWPTVPATPSLFEYVL
jgi:hypothetical protein